MRTGKGFAFWLLSMFMTFCLTAAAWAAMSDEDFVQLCEEGTVKEIRAELQKEANPNAKDRVGNTALMLATKNPNPEVVSLLLKAGADVNVKDMDGGTALIWSVTPNSTSEVLSTLLKAGADSNAKDNNNKSALDWALWHGNTDAIKELMEFTAVPVGAMPDEDFIELCEKGTVKEIRTALLKGTDPDVKEKEGMTTVMVAAMSHAKWEH